MLGNNSKAGYKVETGFCQIPVRAEEEETDKKNEKKNPVKIAAIPAKTQTEYKALSITAT
jgi:hypothetical protein